MALITMLCCLDQRENMTVNIIGLVKWYLNHGIQHILEDKMLIDISNAEVINSKQINIHDDILNELTFDRNEKKLTLFFESLTEPRNFYHIICNNVLSFDITSCNFWGESPHVLDFEYVSEPEEILFLRLKDMHQSHFDSLCNLNKKCFESIITFVSGDELRIVCEEINYLK